MVRGLLAPRPTPIPENNPLSSVLDYHRVLKLKLHSKYNGKETRLRRFI